MVDQNVHEQFFIDKLLAVLQLEAEEENMLKTYIATEGVECFFKQYTNLALKPETLIKVKALVALLEARYED